MPTTPEVVERFCYRRLLLCGSCGAGVTAELTTNRHGSRYVYYHCARKDPRRVYCPERSIEERQIDNALAEFLDLLTLPDGLVDAVIDELARNRDRFRASRQRRVAEAQAAVNRVDRLLEGLRRMRASDEICAADFARDQEGYLAERAAAEQRVAALNTEEDDIEPWRTRLSLLNRAKDQFVAGGPIEKRELVLATTSNLRLKDRKLLIEAKDHFRPFIGIGRFPLKQAVRDIVRTLSQCNDNT